MKFYQDFASFLVNESAGMEGAILESLRVSELNSMPFHLTLVKNGVVDERVVFQKLGEFLGIEYKQLQITEVDIELYQKFPREKILELKSLPIAEDEKYVTLLVSDPFRLDEAKELGYFTDKRIKFALVEPTQMDALINYADNRIQQQSALSDVTKTETSDAIVDLNMISIDAPVIKLCDSILKDAVSRGASDIHIEPFEKEVSIRFRIDGKLQVIDKVQSSYYQSILARFKIMSEMNIAERRIPQDGKINLEIQGKKYDFRVSTIPTLFGEKLVIRIYDISLASSSIQALGFSEEQEKLVLSMIHRPHGIILLTGPTGSGKSTTLYTFLRYLNKPDVNIITVEDPVENQIPGINQVQVNPKAQLTFGAALRSILRQDPNVIMIGEIRDEETAQIATRAAITGHLVVSTIHTNDAAGVVTRLINMGIPPYLVADSLLGSISQRLVRKLCPKCKRAHKTTAAEMVMLGIKEARQIYEPIGCSACNYTGYAGRIGVFEIMVTDENIKQIIMKPNFTSEELNRNAGIRPLLYNAKERVLNGETSISEFEDLNEVVSIERK